MLYLVPIYALYILRLSAFLVYTSFKEGFTVNGQIEWLWCPLDKACTPSFSPFLKF